MIVAVHVHGNPPVNVIVSYRRSERVVAMLTELIDPYALRLTPYALRLTPYALRPGAVSITLTGAFTCTATSTITGSITITLRPAITATGFGGPLD